MPRRRAVCRNSRQPSIQVTGVWREWRPGRAMVKAAEADTLVPTATPSTPMPPPSTSSTPAIRGAGNLRQTMPLPVPARHSNARQRSTDVCQHELSVYGILVNCRPPISPHVVKRDIIRWPWLQWLVCCIGADSVDSAISVTLVNDTRYLPWKFSPSIFSFSLSVTRLVLTPTPNPKWPTKPKCHHKMSRPFSSYR